MTEKVLVHSSANVYCEHESKHEDDAVASVYLKTFSRVWHPNEIKVNQV